MALQLVRKFPSFLLSENSLSCLQKAAGTICPYFTSCFKFPGFSPLLTSSGANPSVILFIQYAHWGNSQYSRLQFVPFVSSTPSLKTFYLHVLPPIKFRLPWEYASWRRSTQFLPDKMEKTARKTTVLEVQEVMEKYRCQRRSFLSLSPCAFIFRVIFIVPLFLRL